MTQDYSIVDLDERKHRAPLSCTGVSFLRSCVAGTKQSRLGPEIPALKDAEHGPCRSLTRPKAHQMCDRSRKARQVTPFGKS